MTRTLFLVGAALALPAALNAQQSAPQPPAAPPAAPAQAAPVPTPQEVATIRQRLGALQQRAAQDPAVQAAKEAFGAEVLAAMQRLDTAAVAKTARAGAIQAEVATAREANDNAKINALAAEATALQSYFTALRERAMALPDIEQKRKAYVDQLFARMTALDAEAPALVAKLDAARAAGVQAPAGGGQAAPSQR